MAADSGHDGKTERTERGREAGVALTAIGGVITFVITFAQLVESVQSGKFTYILSAIIALMVVIGVTVLLTMDKRRNPLMSAAIMLVILIFVATFFAITSGRLLLFPPGNPQYPPSDSPLSSTVAPPTISPSSTTSAITVASLPAGSPIISPPRSIRPSAAPSSPGTDGDDLFSSLPSTTALVSSQAPRGTFVSPFSEERVTGRDLSTFGNIEGVVPTLLCIVRDESGNYFPYDAQSSDGRWSAVVGIGPSALNRPLSFTLLLTTATRSAVDEIRNRRQSDPEYNEYGLGSTLPHGIEELARVGIVRDS